jgi:hypothetical protein
VIEEYVDHWEENKSDLREKYTEVHPGSYTEIVSDVVQLISEEVDRGGPDPEHIHVIDDGHYQGTQVYVIAEDTYQPSNYFYVRVAYGSCSGCDTLLNIRGGFRDNEEPSNDQTDQYMRLALHIFQSLKRMDPESYA